MTDAAPASQRRFQTPWGPIVLAATDRGLVRATLPGAPGARLRPAVPPSRAADRHLDRAERQVREYLAGRRKTFSVPLDLRAVTPFRRKVLLACRQVPYGTTVTYGQLAARAGRPMAARAVGQAMASNPVPLVIPCHRVLAAGGGLGGFMGAAAGGLCLKRRLLELEGVRTGGRA